jgi:hypothetical protein
MADSKISALPAATTPLAGTELIPIVQSGVTKKIAANGIQSGPAFSAYANGATSITGGAFTKIPCNIEEFDTNLNYDNATNYRFTPTVAGYYQINGQIQITSAITTRLIAILYKNGSPFKYGVDLNAACYSTVVSALIYLNGSTDYVELYAYTAITATLSSAGLGPYFQASLTRSA